MGDEAKANWKELNAKCIALSSKTKGATVGRAARLALWRLSVTAVWRKARRARVAVAMGGALDPSSLAAGVPPLQP